MELLKPYIPSLLPSLTEEVGRCLTWAEKGVTSIPGWSLGRHPSHLSVDEGLASYTTLLPWWVLLSGPSSTLPPCSHSSPLSSLLPWHCSSYFSLPLSYPSSPFPSLHRNAGSSMSLGWWSPWPRAVVFFRAKGGCGDDPAESAHFVEETEV